LRTTGEGTAGSWHEGETALLADEVFNWLSGLPDWQRDLARRLTSQIDLEEAEYTDALATVRGAFGLPTETLGELEPLQREHIAAGTTDEDVRLLTVGSLRGVGLVDEREQLDFAGDGLTLIYGQNAAGKSTFVRVLKKLCRTVDHDCHIRGSIYDQDPPPPSSRIQLKINGALVERRISLEGTAERIPGMSVFDSACAELYVDSQNKVQYIPNELRLLARLAVLQDRMHQDLGRERDALQRQEPPLDDYPAETTVGQALRQLTGATTDPDIDRLSSLDLTDEARLHELRLVLATAQTSTARADAAAAERESNEAEQLAAAIETWLRA
jgi:energy-coupling factor transporter ATP-binding protein EcfA2